MLWKENKDWPITETTAKIRQNQNKTANRIVKQTIEKNLSEILKDVFF